MNCQTLTIEEVDQTFFGQGYRQAQKAIKVCKGCDFLEECGKLVEADTWGVFAGKAYRDGKVVQDENGRYSIYD